MIEQILAVVLLALLSFFLYLVFLSDERTDETYYKVTIRRLRESGLLECTAQALPVNIIVEKNNNLSKWRRFVLTIYNKLRGREVEDVVYIFQEEKHERRALIIRQAVKGAFLYADLLDSGLREALETYYAYKYACTFVKGEAKVKTVLQKAYENAQCRKQVVVLDDASFSEKIVINPPPERKSILEITVIPMISAKSMEAVEKQYDFAARERYRILFHSLVDNLAECSAAVIFIGDLPSEKYVEMFGNNVLRCHGGIILSAIGHKTPKLDYVVELIAKAAKGTWAVELVRERIFCKWQFEKGLIDRCWTIIHYRRIGSRSSSDT